MCQVSGRPSVVMERPGLYTIYRDYTLYTDGHVWTGLQVIYRLYTGYIQVLYRQARWGHKACIINNKECSHEYLSGYLADADEARGCSTNTFVIHSLIQWWFVKISLWRRHALIELLDQKLQQFSLNRWILPVGRVALGRVRAQPAMQVCFFCWAANSVMFSFWNTTIRYLIKRRYTAVYGNITKQKLFLTIFLKWQQTAVIIKAPKFAINGA